VPKPLKLTIPPEAHHFSVWRVRVERTRNVEGRMKSHHTYDRCRGEPQPDGTVPEVWPIVEFSAPRVLDHWGPGRYRIDFFNAAGDQIKPGVRLEVAEPVAKGPKLSRSKPRPGRAGDDQQDDDRHGARATPDSMSAWEVMAMLDQREQRATERITAQFQAQGDRDRAFMSSMMQLATSGRGAPGGESTDLLRRELGLTVEKELFRIRKDLAASIGQLAAEREEEEPDDDDGPKDLDEAGERIGLALLRELEQRAPELIEEAIPQLVRWLQGKGFQPSDRLRQRMQAKTVNGAPRADDE